MCTRQKDVAPRSFLNETTDTKIRGNERQARNGRETERTDRQRDRRDVIRKMGERRKKTDGRETYERQTRD